MLKCPDLGSSHLAEQVLVYVKVASLEKSSMHDFSSSLGITLFICTLNKLDKMTSKDPSSSKFCDYILNVRTTWCLLASPLMKLTIIYLVKKKAYTNSNRSAKPKMSVCGFLSHPRLSSDACDECECLLN